jgi:nucleotide-binding universal stress UspA family protein
MLDDERPIVVGVDGSPGADEALTWAVGEAGLWQTRLRLTYVYLWRPLDPRRPWYTELPEAKLQLSGHIAEGILSRAVRRVGALDASVKVEYDVLGGHAVEVLLGETRQASMLVLGSRHLTAIGPAIHHSVGGAGAARAACPVVVVQDMAKSPADRAAVAVGVDGTHAADTVLAFAFEYASRHRAAVRVALCWRSALMWHVKEPERAKTWLSATLAGWRRKYPEVDVHPCVVNDHPVAGLQHASPGQRLLVVGSRGRHALAGTLLGSVSQGALHHATCPVAVVPTHTG